MCMYDICSGSRHHRQTITSTTPERESTSYHDTDSRVHCGLFARQELASWECQSQTVIQLYSFTSQARNYRSPPPPDFPIDSCKLHY